ncbi:hypothetical protein K503DRAFT_307713 [Rhizopogon vinicolor AM-OR11-026]|uniref:Helicase C-terminal domain-containing protein n=1 Tax=Rhizopogon vinicolor AM-OR11-026 TaxID=1314800 RepID=A0A1B7NCU0_9AGAM|nr:hypothetical protein K503DRAFT_307713 [Rhizopogon vinicolor AM-OR11-026]
MFNTLNWKSYNDETLALWRDNDDAQIIVATAVLAVGMDSLKFDIIVIYGEPSADLWWQVLGRIRPRQTTSLPRGNRPRFTNVNNTLPLTGPWCRDSHHICPSQGLTDLESWIVVLTVSTVVKTHI